MSVNIKVLESRCQGSEDFRRVLQNVVRREYPGIVYHVVRSVMGEGQHIEIGFETNTNVEYFRCFEGNVFNWVV